MPFFEPKYCYFNDQNVHILAEMGQDVERLMKDNTEVQDDLLDPLVVWKLLLDKNSPKFGGFKDCKRDRSCTFDVKEIRNACMTTLKFIFRFVATMGVLYVSAIMFAYLEHTLPSDGCAGDNTEWNVSTSAANHSLTNNTSQQLLTSNTSFRSFLLSMDNITFTDCDLEHLTMYVENVQQRQVETLKSENDWDHLSVQKWFYFGIIATTTIGYGDKVPMTFIGKVIGGMCAISGVLAIALPVPVVVSNFERFYKRDRVNNNGKNRAVADEEEI